MIRDHVRSKRESGIVAVARLLMDAESDLFKKFNKTRDIPDQLYNQTLTKSR